jgi:hypothetical protein
MRQIMMEKPGVGARGIPDEWIDAGRVRIGFRPDMCDDVDD